MKYIVTNYFILLKMETFRFNFSSEFKQSLIYFSNKHKDDDLDTFKDNFETWCQTNALLIEDEKIALKRCGFNSSKIIPE